MQWVGLWIRMCVRVCVCMFMSMRIRGRMCECDQTLIARWLKYLEVGWLKLLVAVLGLRRASTSMAATRCFCRAFLCLILG